MENETGHEIVMAQFGHVQLQGRAGNLDSAKTCLEATKIIWNELKDVDKTVADHIEYYQKNYDNMMKNFK